MAASYPKRNFAPLKALSGTCARRPFDQREGCVSGHLYGTDHLQLAAPAGTAAYWNEPASAGAGGLRGSEDSRGYRVLPAGLVVQDAMTGSMCAAPCTNKNPATRAGGQAQTLVSFLSSFLVLVVSSSRAVSLILSLRRRGREGRTWRVRKLAIRRARCLRAAQPLHLDPLAVRCRS